jgi:O-antigen/teichoic acid export membrane protein
VLNIVLIPYYGIIGAAMATSFSVLFFVFTDTFFAWKFTRMNPFDIKAILKSFFAGAVSLVFVLLMYRYTGISSSVFTLIPLFLLFLLVYFVLLIVFRTLDRNDIFILTEIEKKSGVRIGFIRRIFKRLVK